MKEQDDVIIALVKALTDHQQSNGALPVRYDRESPLPMPVPQGFFARLFDRHSALKDDYALRRLIVMHEAQLKALEHEATGYVEIERIDQESKVRLHEHEVLQKEAVLKKQAEARAQILLHNLQQSLIAQVGQIGLDAVDEQYLLAKIVSICMRTDKEKPHGRK